MNYLKRGFLSITRKPMKSLILFLVVFILGNLMAGAVSIKKTLNTTEQNMNKNLQPIASAEIDWEAISAQMEEDGVDESSEEAMKYYEDVQYIDEKAIQQIGELSYVKYYDYSATWYGQSKELKNYYSDEDSTTTYYADEEGESFTLQGVQYYKMLKMEEGQISLKEGRVFTQKDVDEGKNYLVIGSNFAQKNNLSVGSMISLFNNVYETVAEDEVLSEMPKVIGTIEKEFEVIGIFETKTLPVSSNANSNEASQQQYLQELAENTFYTTNGAVIEMTKEYQEKAAENGEVYDESTYYDPIFVLKENSMLEDFSEEASAFLPKYGRIIDTTQSLDSVKKPMESINKIATIVLYASIGVAVLILSLLTTLFLHERRHEIGIYIAMGERKGKVVGQIVSEFVIVSLVAMTLALVVGNFVSKDVSKSLLIEQTESTSDDDGFSISSIDGYTDLITTEDLIDSYNVSLDGGTIVMFYGVSMATVVISTIIPTMYILRLKPKEILM